MLRKTYKLRLNLLFLLPVICIGFILPRLYFLQIMKHEKYQELADAQHSKKIDLIPWRGKILDRNGRELAASTMLDTLYAKPKLLREHPEKSKELAHDLAALLSLDFDKLNNNFQGKREMPIARKLTGDQVKAVQAILRKYKKILPENVLYFVREGKRSYPRNELASHIIGYTVLDNTGDNKGLEGIELQFDHELRGEAKQVVTSTNAKQDSMEPVDQNVRSATYGSNVVLTIDESIQRATELALRKRVLELGADCGIAIVYGIKTGEIFAMTSCPSFDLNDVTNTTHSQRRNRVITDSIEPGSVMKIFTFTSALEEKKISLDSQINCEGGSWTPPGRGKAVTDHESLGTVSAREVFAHSSNIGSVKIGMMMRREQFYRHLCDFGFGEKTGVDLPGEARGLLRPMSEWSDASMSSLPMGYELQVSGIQVASAASAIVNNGIYMKPHIVKEIRNQRNEVIMANRPEELRRVCKPETSKLILELMEGVVLAGTGRPARLDLWRVGGKTGTTTKMDKHGGYNAGKQNITSFCGVAPMEDPEICIYVWLDNPKGETMGGAASAPVFKEICEATLKILSIKPSPTQPVMPKWANAKAPQPVKKKPEHQTTADMEVDTTEARRLLAEARPADPVSSGSMPNLEGLTMLEAKEKLDSFAIPYSSFKGTGVVVEQHPKPYETVEPGDAATVTFGSKEQYLEMLAIRAVGREGMPAAAETATPGAATSQTATLRIEGGHKTVEVPIKDPGVSKPPTAATPTKRPTQPEATPLPDTDTHAKRTPLRDGGKKTWAEWEKARASKATPTPKPEEQDTAAEEPKAKQTSTARSRTRKQPSSSKTKPTPFTRDPADQQADSKSDGTDTPPETSKRGKNASPNKIKNLYEVSDQEH